MENMSKDKKEVILKSPTGSGKTIMLTNFIYEYGKGNFGNVFIWLTPGKGNLEEQSKEKMDKYIHNSRTKLLRDVMTDGFHENDACFINWEKLTKKGNNALKESEKGNFEEKIAAAHRENLEFIIIIDESHQNDTVKADDIITLFNPKKIIRTSATPKNYGNATIINIPEEDVIEEGLIKKVLIINEDFGSSVKVDNQISYLIDKSLKKQEEIKKSLKEINSIVNPLIIIQLPNKSDVLQDEVERYLAKRNITYENGLLAVWLSNKKQNLEEIEKMDAKPIVIIIKQAIATGWDCPRAQILVKLRENSSETFEIQTIGRIRRMPEARHYEDDLLDSCYLYTFDEKFTEGVKSHLGKGALDAIKLFLKKKHREVKLISEQKTSVFATNDAVQALDTMSNFYRKHYNISTKFGENKKILQREGYTFSDEIVRKTYTGSVSKLVSKDIHDLDKVKLIEPLNTHKHGREYHNKVSLLGIKLSLPYEQMNTIIRRLFDKNVKFQKKILKLETKEVYSFILNNFAELTNDFRIAMSDITLQPLLDLKNITEKSFSLPKEFMFTYDGKNKIQKEYETNVYSGYLSSAEIRSDSEKSFEKYCNENPIIDWIYKNGDKGNEYLSIVYLDNFGKQKSFYPDYLISSNEELWIIETKGGFNRYGVSEDIDRFSSKKFEVLKRYLDKHKIKGGFVRKDKSNNELFICTDNFNDDIQSDEWVLLDSVLQKGI